MIRQTFLLSDAEESRNFLLNTIQITDVMQRDCSQVFSSQPLWRVFYVRAC